MLSSKKYVSYRLSSTAEDFQEVIEESDDDSIKYKLKKSITAAYHFTHAKFQKTNYEESTAVYQPKVIQPSTDIDWCYWLGHARNAKRLN